MTGSINLAQIATSVESDGFARHIRKAALYVFHTVGHLAKSLERAFGVAQELGNMSAVMYDEMLTLEVGSHEGPRASDQM